MEITKSVFDKYKLKIITYSLLFILLLGVCNTSIYYTNLKPFGISIILALMFIKFNGYLLSIIYLIASICSSFSINNLASSILILVVLFSTQFIINRKKFALNKKHIFILGILCELTFAINNFYDKKESLALIVTIILGLLFLYSSIIFFEATINRCMVSKLNLDEKLSSGVIVIIFAIGISNMYLWGVNIGLLFASLITLLISFISSFSISICVSVLLGLGFAITTLNPIYISLFIVMALASTSFKCNIKILSSISLGIAFVIFNLIFCEGLYPGDIIGIAVGGVIFCLIPNKWIHVLSNVFVIKEQIIVKNIINISKNKVVSRIRQLSKIFNEMDIVYRNMVRGLLTDQDAISLLKEELVSGVCKDCSNYNICHRQSGSFVEHSLDTVLHTAYSKGKVNLIDIPSYLTSNCVKLNVLINNLNQMLSSYKEYSTAISNLDTSRILIAEQLNGVSKLLDNLSDEVNLNIHFDNKFENRIKEDLSYKNVVCLECAVYEKDIDTKFVNLVIKSDTINEKVIEKVVSKIIGGKFIINKIEGSDIEGMSIVNMSSRPHYDIIYGSTVITKTGKVVCGDSHSLIKVDDGKYMVSICDGMGSGKEANKISVLTINLIENFYRAGFQNDIILSSVNKLLNLTENENFSTIDLCVIDCKKNIYDFIKLGATNGYIKRYKGEVEIIESSSLPIGVLEEIKPHTTKRLISPFDMLVFMSDGVSDIFENKIDFKNYLLNLDIINPQQLSENIMAKALEINNNIASDDMTVVCVRVFEWL